MAIRHNPMDAIAYSERSAIYAARGSIDRCIADLDEAIRLNPKFALAYSRRGWTRMQQVTADYAYASTIKSQTADSPSAAEKSNASSPKYGNSEQPATKITIDANFSSYLPGGMAPSQPKGTLFQDSVSRQKAYASQIKREIEQALADYAEAIRLDPKKSDYYMGHGMIHSVSGENEKALADLAEAIRLNPKNTEAFSNRSYVYQNKGDIDKAIADMTEVIRLNPKSAEAFDRRANLYSQKHETDKAAADIAQAMRLRPEDDRYR